MKCQDVTIPRQKRRGGVTKKQHIFLMVGPPRSRQRQLSVQHRLIEVTPRYAHNLAEVRNPCPNLVMKMVGKLE